MLDRGGAAARGRSETDPVTGQLCADVQRDDVGVVDVEDVGALKGPAGGVPAGPLVCLVAAWWSVCGDFGGGGFVDDGLAFGVGGDEGLDGEVVDGAGQAAAGGVDQGGGVVAE